MKIEKVSDNQIRCTLTGEDLEGRHLKVAELAYGSEKARALFRDMMQQAAAQLGFEAENIPLVIETIPLNSNCIVILITKVEDPEELDTRFASFSPEIQNEALGEPQENSVSSSLNALLNAIRSAAEQPDEEDGQDVPEEDGSGESDSGTETAAAQEQSPRRIAQAGSESSREIQKIRRYAYTHRLFVFDSMNELIEAAGLSAPKFRGRSALYADRGQGLYYLVLVFDGAGEVPQMQSVLALLSEYADQEVMSYARGQYLQEHCESLLPENALPQLAKASH